MNNQVLEKPSVIKQHLFYIVNKDKKPEHLESEKIHILVNIQTSY